MYRAHCRVAQTLVIGADIGRGEIGRGKKEQGVRAHCRLPHKLRVLQFALRHADAAANFAVQFIRVADEQGQVGVRGEQMVDKVAADVAGRRGNRDSHDLGSFSMPFA